MISWHDLLSSSTTANGTDPYTPHPEANSDGYDLQWHEHRSLMDSDNLQGPLHCEQSQSRECRSAQFQSSMASQPSCDLQDFRGMLDASAGGIDRMQGQLYTKLGHDACPTLSDYWQTTSSRYLTLPSGGEEQMLEQEPVPPWPPLAQCTCRICNNALPLVVDRKDDERILSLCSSTAPYIAIVKDVQDHTGIHPLEYALDVVNALLSSCPARQWGSNRAVVARQTVEAIAKLVLHQLDQEQGYGSSGELLRSIQRLLDELVAAVAPVRAMQCPHLGESCPGLEPFDIEICDLAASMVTELSTQTCGTGLPTLALLSCTQASLSALPCLAGTDDTNQTARQRSAAWSQAKTLQRNAFASNTVLLQVQQQLVSLLEPDCYSQVPDMLRLVTSADHIETFAQAAGNIAAISDICNGRAEQQRPPALQIIRTQAETVTQALLECLRKLSPAETEGSGSQKPKTPPRSSTQAGDAFIRAPLMRRPHAAVAGSSPPRAKRKLAAGTEKALGVKINASRPTALVSAQVDTTAGPTLPQEQPMQPTEQKAGHSDGLKGAYIAAGQPPSVHFWSFEDARKYVHQLQLNKGHGTKYAKKASWLMYCRSGQKPAEVPTYPNLVYGSRWKSWSDWFGKHNA